MQFIVTVRIAARSHDAVDIIQTGIGTFNERFWARILSADSANVDVVLEHLVQRLDTPRRTLPFGVQLVGYRLQQPSCRLFVEHLPHEEYRVRVYDVLLRCPVYPVPEQLMPVAQFVLGIVVHAPPDVLQHLPAVVLRHCVYQALNEHALGTTRRDVLRSRCISRPAFV